MECKHVIMHAKLQYSKEKRYALYNNILLEVIFYCFYSIVVA